MSYVWYYVKLVFGLESHFKRYFYSTVYVVFKRYFYTFIYELMIRIKLFWLLKFKLYYIYIEIMGVEFNFEEKKTYKDLTAKHAYGEELKQ